MKIKPFALERFFAKYEFSAPYLLSCSDAEPFTLKELLAMADEETYALWENLSLGYTESQGHPLLLQEIAELYEGITPQHVVEIVPEEGVFIAMNVLLEPEDHVITTFPGYQSLFEIAASIGCHVSKWQPDFTHGLKLSVNDLKRLVRDNTKLIVINFPHNPTGALLSRGELQEVIALAKKKGICVFSDEMYRFTELTHTDRLPSVCELYPKSISLFGLSKSFSLPGLRVGWLVTRNVNLIEDIKSYKDYTTICGSAPSEILALIALRAREAILARNRVIITHNLEALDKFFKEHNDVFTWIKPRGGTVGFPELLLDIPVDQFCQQLLEKKGVLLLPASVIGSQSNHFRVGFGRRDMPEVLEKLAEFLNETGSI
jgi:aspartate/methionine/tyrosine aminotransferase